ncbi:MAG TPA: sigma-70 family RNA polymerase sigma factor [Bacteroidota bacterium]
MKEDSDILIVRQCLNGDTRAFETIVEKYQRPLFNAALRIIDNYQDAEDVTQTAFVKAFEKLSTFDPKFKFFSWLYRIAVNEALNLVNQRKPQEGVTEDLPSEDKAPDEKYDENEMSEMIQDALMTLKVDHRIVIVLKHFHDLSYKEMGQILDLPEKTVKSRLFMAREQLKSRLTRKGAGND